MAPDQSSVLSVSDSVADTKDDDPNEAIVIKRPSGQTITDWEYETASGVTTTAEENPAYPADEQLVIVAFRSDLADAIDDWQALDTESLFEAVVEHDINRYGFPKSRLEQIEPGELDSEWLDSIAERFGDAGWEVTHNTAELIVTQYDEEASLLMGLSRAKASIESPWRISSRWRTNNKIVGLHSGGLYLGYL
jgi:hypothetical protein